MISSRTFSSIYDGLQRLQDISAVLASSTTAYSDTYDLAGNWLSVWQNGVQLQDRCYDDANQVIGWSYDATGNLIDDSSTSYGYDPLNRLLAQGSTTNTYNGDGVLITQAMSSGTITYTQDLVSPLSLILADNTARYVYGNERLLGVAGSTETWYSTDALGSLRQTLDAVGDVCGARSAKGLRS